jgi:hypothetical protein
MTIRIVQRSCRHTGQKDRFPQGLRRKEESLSLLAIALCRDSAAEISKSPAKYPAAL